MQEWRSFFCFLKCWFIQSTPYLSAAFNVNQQIHSWILLKENHLRIRKKNNLEHKSLIYQRKNLTNIPSQQFYISWCFYFLDIWHFWPNGSSSQKVRVGFIIFLTFRRWRWISWRFMTRKSGAFNFWRPWLKWNE